MEWADRLHGNVPSLVSSELFFRNFLKFIIRNFLKFLYTYLEEIIFRTHLMSSPWLTCQKGERIKKMLFLWQRIKIQLRESDPVGDAVIIFISLYNYIWIELISNNLKILIVNTIGCYCWCVCLNRIYLILRYIWHSFHRSTPYFVDFCRNIR